MVVRTVGFADIEKFFGAPATGETFEPRINNDRTRMRLIP